jgi:hypothetical protein
VLFHLNFRGRRLVGRSRTKMLSVEVSVGHWLGCCRCETMSATVSLFTIQASLDKREVVESIGKRNCERARALLSKEADDGKEQGFYCDTSDRAGTAIPESSRYLEGRTCP